MAQTFSFAFNAVVPMMLLMLIGFFARKKGYFDDHVLKKMNAFAFNAGIPALMFCNVYSLSGLQDIPFSLMGFVLVSLCVITLVGIAAAAAWADKRSQKGVIVQVAFRSNYAIIGATMAAALGGTEGSIISTSLQAPSILYFNIAAVICLTVFSDDPERSVDLKGITRSILTNPLILAQLAGVVCLALRLVIPQGADGLPLFSLSGSLPWLYSVLNSLSKMASPLVLILLGAQVDFGSAAGIKKQLVAGTILRLAIAPAIGFLMAVAADKIGLILLTPAAVSALISLYGSPSPAAAAVMSEQMGGDGELGRQYVVWTTALSTISLFLWILILRFIGLL